MALQVRTRDAFPNDCRRTARNLGHFQFEQQAWSEAARAYTTALSAAEVLYQACILLDSKATELAETADLPRRAAYALVRTGNLQAAALTLEQGRARGLSESLSRDRSDLTQLQQRAPHLYTQYQDLTTQLRTLESQQRDRMTSGDRHSLTPEAHRNEATRLRQELTTTIDQIRQVPSYEDFLMPTKWADIAIALRRDNPLVYLVTTPNGGMALIVTVDAIDHVWLDGFNETQLVELLDNTWFNTYRNWGDAIQRLKVAIKELKENRSETNQRAYKQAESVYKQAEADWYDAIASVTRQLWEPLIQPLIQHLTDHNIQQATLIPTGYLSLLPLHAAWVNDPTHPTGKRYALDEIGLTYAPNARSLTAAKAIAQPATAEAMVAIDNPLKDLPNSSREVAAAIASFPQPKVLQHEAATIESVLAALPDCNFLHLSCHGTANLREPLNSGLAMNDGLLTLRQFLDLKLSEQGGIRLVVLSACETGMIGIENADEAISLPTGLLQAGVAGVVASLWAVSDRSTMLLLTKFYDLWRNGNHPPDQALRQAQIWLRDTTNDEKVLALRAVLPEFPNSPHPKKPSDRFLGLPEAIARTLYNDLVWEDPNERSYAHPFHWAAFGYTGI